jgi:hypothetical protein
MRPEGAIAKREHVRFANAMTMGMQIGVLQVFVDETACCVLTPSCFGSRS